MARPDFGCGRPECCASTGIHDKTTFGTGDLDSYGFWEFPCKECEEEWEKSLRPYLKNRAYKTQRWERILDALYASWIEECPGEFIRWYRKGNILCRFDFRTKQFKFLPI